MQAGFAHRTIDPPLEMAMDGFLRDTGAVTLHDSLHVRVLSLTDGAVQVLIVGIDLLFMDRPDVDRLKGALGRNLHLLPEQIFLNFSHNHGGPRISRWHYLGVPDPAYVDLLESALVTAAREATANQRAATMEAGVGKTTLPISRRRPNEQGIAEFRPHAAGPIFPDCSVCLIRGVDGAVISLIFSIGCHPSGIHTAELTAEYPGAAVRELNEHFRTGGALFLQGAGGDTKARCLAVGEEHFRDATWADVEQMGHQLAAEVEAVIEHELHSIHPELASALVDVALPLCPLPSHSSLQAMLAAPDTPVSRRCWAQDMLDQLKVHRVLPDQACIGIHLVQFGKTLSFIGVEAELGSELGRQIQDVSSTDITFILGYTNGSRLNLPCDRQLPEGGYGVDTYWEYHWPSQLAPGIDQRVRETVQNLTPNRLQDV